MTTRRKRNTQQRNQDDLTRINGIGKARQQWLRDKLNVNSLKELAALAPEEIETKLKADNQIVSRPTIESWIVQAAQWADIPTRITAKDEGWKPIASFVVEFQEYDEGASVEQRTRVHHVEADKNRMWSGIEYTELCEWMVQQLGGQLRQPAEQNMDSMIEANPQPFVEVGRAASSLSGAFSEKLQLALAKAERIRLAAMPILATEADFGSTGSNERPAKELSQQLRAALAKADKLSSQAN